MENKRERRKGINGMRERRRYSRSAHGEEERGGHSRTEDDRGGERRREKRGGQRIEEKR